MQYHVAPSGFRVQDLSRAAKFELGSMLMMGQEVLNLCIGTSPETVPVFVIDRRLARVTVKELT